MKNLKILFTIFFIFLFVSGCQTVKQKTDAAIQKENKKLSEFIGQSASKLQMELGKPDEDFENEKGNFLFIYKLSSFNLRATDVIRSDIFWNRFCVDFQYWLLLTPDSFFNFTF